MVEGQIEREYERRERVQIYTPIQGNQKPKKQTKNPVWVAQNPGIYLSLDLQYVIQRGKLCSITPDRAARIDSYFHNQKFYFIFLP